MQETKIQSYRDLIVWQKSMDLAVLACHLTENYPKFEIYGLTSQMRRCSVSIPSNIAEGRLRGTRKDFRQFLIIALASAGELNTQLELGKRLKYLSEDNYLLANGLLVEIMKMLNKIISTLGS